jgi:hypothetical protein
MKREEEPDGSPRHFFSAPWDPITERRGDALGLRALVDVFADAVAPDLSNRVQDGRWVTILAWCLARSQSVYHAAGGGHVMSRAQQQQRYAWLRPLELMWVARTIRFLDDNEARQNRTLSGQRRVRPWLLEDFKKTQRFGMSADQFRAYRQTGMYGGYRVAFRRWLEMTIGGDGWTPGPATSELARWLDSRLGPARPDHMPVDSEDGVSTRSAKLGLGNEAGWWLRHWSEFEETGRGADLNTLPRPRTEHQQLPESHLLEPLVFGDGYAAQRRRTIARHIEISRPATHAEACDALGAAFGDDSTIRYLPRLSRLADAGMEIMELIAGEIQRKGTVHVREVASSSHAKAACATLAEAATAWRQASATGIRHLESAHRLADSVACSRPIDCLRALLQHHALYGGGHRWFVDIDGRIEPRTPPRGTSSRYRFRLWSLCRLGKQCGVLRTMPRGLTERQEVVDEMAGEGE